MDARSTFLRPAALVFSLLALAGCSTTPKPQVNPGLELFNEALTLPALEHSIVREGDRVMYAVELKQKSAILRFSASCAQGPGRMFYPTRDRLRPYTDPQSTGFDLPAAQARQLQQSAQLQNACKARPAPDWRMLAPPSEADWLLVDRNSLEHRGNLLYVWAAHDYQHYRITGGASLFAKEQEQLALDCKQQTIALLSRFNIDESSQAINGEIPRQLKPQTLNQAPADHVRVFKAACQAPEELARLPTPKARQALPPVISTPIAKPAVLDAIQALDLPKPARALNQLTYDYDAVLFNRTRVGDQTKQTSISTDAASGQTLVLTQDSALGYTLDLTFRGLFALASQSIDLKTGNEAAPTRAMVGLSFQGDWRNLPVGSEVSYTPTWSKSINPDGSPSADNSEIRAITCKVVKELPASTLNPDLQGPAKVLGCIQMKGWDIQYAYLADYGLFIKVREDAIVAQWDWRLKSVK
ncbi:hypothetical protein [uncultured Pseudomonas sp.]|uniref:hypothetical protein n=1 Tax=uncultured Pseudomonas sp. TaxID=114707 RepID=UPI0025D3EA96|nr:hypothetical protein [uncultured Pseudomonas sp.]